MFIFEPIESIGLYSTKRVIKNCLDTSLYIYIYIYDKINFIKNNNKTT